MAIINFEYCFFQRFNGKINLIPHRYSSFFVIPAKSWNPLAFDIYSIPDALCCVRNDWYWKEPC
jgi:hypothetical protein